MYALYCRLNLHVHASDRSVIRAVRRKINPNALRDPHQREARKVIYRRLIEEHQKARDIVTHFRL